ncbi:MAG: TadE/TadG family type IV pilus assembly protein [Anaerolineales bacterium]
MRNLDTGQGVIEFALFLPILLFLIIGTISIGQAFHIKVILENAAREGALYMVYYPDEGKANSFALSKDAVRLEAQNSGVEILDEDIDIHCDFEGTENNNCPEGSIVIVTVQHELSVIFDGLLGGPFNLSNDARMLIP